MGNSNGQGDPATPKTTEELRAFIINEVKHRRPQDADHADRIADAIVGGGHLNVQAFMEGYLGKPSAAAEELPIPKEVTK